jgi:hypothetical protein
LAFVRSLAASGGIIIPIGVTEVGGHGRLAFGSSVQRSDCFAELAESLGGFGADRAAFQFDLNSRDLLIEEQGLFVWPGDSGVIEVVE